MKRLSSLLAVLLTLSMLLGAMLPFAAAQDDFTAYLDEFMSGIPKNYYVVKVEDLNTELVDSPPFLLDVRQPAEYEAGHIEGAVNVPLREVAQNLEKLPGLDAPIVVYCKSGHRGALGLTALKLLGYENVRNLYGGIMAWEAAEYPTVTEPTEAEAGTVPDIDADLLARIDAMLTNIPEGWGIVSAEDLSISLAEAEAPFLLDVRTRRELAAGFIEGSVAVEIHNLAGTVGVLPEDLSTPIVVYCGSGWRSAISEAVLWTMGYENVLSLKGGIRAWRAAEYPLAQSMARAADYYLTNRLPEGWGIINAEGLAEALAGDAAPLLVDVRQPEELEAKGYIEGAINIPLRELAQHLDLLPDLDRPVVVYCAKGHRGALAMASLQLLGYQASNLKGGFSAWVEAGYDVAEGPAPEAEAGEVPEVSAFVLEAVDAALSTTPEGWGTITAEALADMLDDEATQPAALIDVREPQEWVADGIIAGATLVPLRGLGTYLDTLEGLVPDKSATIVVYCKGGHRGAIAMQVLRAAGYEDVRNLIGGISGCQPTVCPIAEYEEE